MVKAIYAGTFDPITNGHMDIISRSLSFCDELIVAIGINPGKKPMFSLDQRLQLIYDSVESLYNNFPQGSKKVWADSFDGLLADYANKMGADLLIRGIRSVSDFEYELTLAGVNKVLTPKIETIFLPTSPELAVVSSSMVREIAKHGGDIKQFVPAPVAKAFGFEPKPETGFIKYGDPQK
jgi:pantetheine-phosphate adenylyltransferase